MNEVQDLPSDKPRENEVSDQSISEKESARYDNLEADDSPEIRLQALSIEYAHERAALAEQISQLQEENERLVQRMQELEQTALFWKASVVGVHVEDSYPARALDLDFSLPDELGKG